MKFSDMVSNNHEGAGYIFLTPDDLILFLLKRNGKYTFAGGHREKKETPIQTANRETVEEIGFLPKGRTIDYIKYIKKETGGTCYSFIMKVEKPFAPELSSEHKSFAWIPISYLPKITPSKAVIDALPKLFKKLKNENT
jgi:8-oxo-dGTP pyrophosphatase MutT (NUDIX family)